MVNHSSVIKKCVEVLGFGGVIIYPTDTIWGLGCDATNPQAIERLHKIKKSSHEKSMLILCFDEEEIVHYVEKIPAQALDLIYSTQTPLTIIYPHAKHLPEILLGENNSIGIRIPKNDFCLALLNAFGKPIVSTSANFSGESSPKSFSDISKTLIEKVDFCVPDEIEEKRDSAVASKLVKITENGEVIVIRG